MTSYLGWMERLRWRHLSFFIICAFGILLLALCAWASRNAGGECDLTILHTNDLHAHDQPFLERGRSIGGMARIGYLIKAIKNNRNDVIVLDAGDFFQGTPFFQRYAGEVEVNLLNKAGYDIVTIGNHEFDNGADNLAKQLKLAKFAVISANLDLAKAPDLAKLIQPSLVKVVNGEKMAFIGVITPDLEHVALKSVPVKVKSSGDIWMKPVADEIDRCKQEGINKIILVTHCGVELDKQLAQSLTDVDVIIGGHSHTRLQVPLWVEHKDGTKTVIVQTGSYGRALGKLDLSFNKNGELIESKTQDHLINITERIKEDTDIAAYLKEKAVPFEALKNEIVGNAQAEFDNHFNKTPWDSAIGDLICDALVEDGKSYGARIALQNRGGIRARIENGLVSEEKIQEMLPFDNKVVFATIGGEELINVLEHSLAGPLGGSFLDVAGLEIAYDPLKPKGRRLVFVLAADEKNNWEPIEKDRSYKIVVNDYTFKGGEGYDFSHASKVIYSPDLLSLAFHKYLSNCKNVKPHMPMRICPVTDKLLDIDSKSAGSLLVHLPERGCKVTIACGTKLGVTSFVERNKNPLPVPLETLCIENVPGRKVTGNRFSCDLAFDLSKFDKEPKDAYAVVICRPTTTTSAKAVQVSYPIHLFGQSTSRH